jgi:hypothetical protein
MSGFRLATAGLLLLALVGASPVAASGTVGKHSFTDGRSAPGTTCNYTDPFPTRYLISVTVPAPKAWWPTGNATKSGTVGWWAVLQRKYSSGWSTMKTGAVHKANATTTTAAAFSKETVAYSAHHEDPYRVIVHVAWYGPGGAIMGSATHTVSHYHQQFSGWSHNTTGFCTGSVTILT